MTIISFIQKPMQINSLLCRVFGKNPHFMLCLQPEMGKKGDFMLAISRFGQTNGLLL